MADFEDKEQDGKRGEEKPSEDWRLFPDAIPWSTELPTRYRTGNDDYDLELEELFEQSRLVREGLIRKPTVDEFFALMRETGRYCEEFISEMECHDQTLRSAIGSEEQRLSYFEGVFGEIAYVPTDI